MSTGFLKATDPLANDNYGYRSHKVARKFDSSYSLFGSDIIYNGFVFPPNTKSRATVVMEYDKTGRTIKYLTVAITIEAYISQFDSSVVSAGEPTIDDHMDALKLRLSQPCQPLSFALQGFGVFHVQQNNLYDVDYGPKPQVIDWQPLGGALAARVEWLVTTRIPACPNTSNGLQGLLELSYEISWSIGDAGFFRRAISGSLELAATRFPNTGSIHASNIVNIKAARTLWDEAIAKIRASFPTIGGFVREDDFKVAANKKMINFSFVDTEIPSPQPVPAGILRLNLTESLNSSADFGFKQWSWSLSGDIEVPNSHKDSNIINNKRLAFAAFGMILKERLSRIAGQTYQDKYATDSQEREKLHEVAAIPQTFRISNEMYGNSISPSVSYLIVCPSNILFKATGMLDAIKIQGLTWDNWRNFLEKSQSRIPIVNILPDQEVIVDLCNPLSTQSVSDHLNPKIGTTPSQNILGAVPDKNSSWLKYQNDFKFTTKYFTSAGVLLSEEARSLKDVGTAATVNNANQESDLKVGPTDPKAGVGSTTKYMKPDLHTAAEPITYITMMGKATRLGYPINAPVLISVGKREAMKHGTDVVIPSERPSGLQDKAGNPVNFYHLRWKKDYIINGKPDNWKVTSSGIPQIYQ